MTEVLPLQAHFTGRTDRKDKDFLLRIPFAPEFPQKFCMPDTLSHCTAEELERKEITRSGRSHREQQETWLPGGLPHGNLGFLGPQWTRCHLEVEGTRSDGPAINTVGMGFFQ